MDNYYNSPELFDQLYLLDTYACGTARVSHKEMPEAFKKSVSKEIKLTRGSGIFRTRDHLLALKYHDKRDIHMLSTIHTSECVTFDKKDSDDNYLSKPKCVLLTMSNIQVVLT